MSADSRVIQRLYTDHSDWLFPTAQVCDRLTTLTHAIANRAYAYSRRNHANTD